MSKIFIDAAMTMDGYWADTNGDSIFPIEEMHLSGLLMPVVDRTGAVIMSDISFRMAEDPDWYADNYELQRPIFVVTGHPPDRMPRRNESLFFTFVTSYEDAISQAKPAAGGRDVIVIGEASAVQTMLKTGRVDEIYLRVLTRLLGRGIALFSSDGDPAEFQRISVEYSQSAIHLQLRRRE